MKEEKSGKISELIYYNEENFYSIFVMETESEQFYCVGYMPNPRAGRKVELTGAWKNHPRYGEQFAFSSFKDAQPTGEDGIISFLSSGVIKGIGPATARRIVAKFGEQTLQILQSFPERLTEVSGIGKSKAEAISEGYKAHREYADTVMALSAYEIPANIALKLYGAYGANAVKIVEENPYQLISDIYGIGFRKADKIAARMGFDPYSPFRIKSGILYALNQLSSAGDSYAPKTEFIEDCANFLEVSREMTEQALYDLIMDGHVYIETLDEREVIMLYRFYRAERKVASKLYELCHCSLPHINADYDVLIRTSELKSGIALSPLQKNAVISSIKNGVSVITGGPGTGKTTIINTILEILKAADVKTALAAPTGRAAKRMSETTGEDASTIHRLLEYYYSEEGSEMRFGKDEESPLDCDCVIIDEMSMVDILLMEGLLNAIKSGTRLILVGDADQLPSVGAGNVLRDIIASETVHTVKLTEIFRQAAESMIVVNAHSINRGEYPSFNSKDKDFFFLDRRGEREIRDTILELLSERLPSFYKDCDPAQDIQVLTPTRKGILGSVELNKELQAILNPPSPEKAEKAYAGRIYREGDKVMQNKNDYMLEWKNISDFTTSSGVFNGDIGIIQSVDEDAGVISVLYDNDRLASYDFSTIDEIETAFAMTVHKSQGSEFPVVVMPMSRFAPMLSTRNLLYTAVTRAKQGCVLVGLREACNAMVDNNAIVRRYSGLSPRLRKLWEFDYE